MHRHHLMRFPILPLVLSAIVTCPSTVAAENVGTVSVEGDSFILDGAPFYYVGCNNYYLMVFAADPGLRSYVEEVQAEAAGLGLTVLRTWAFNDGAGQWNALQTSPGVYQEYVFEGLDYVLNLADEYGLRVILPLVNDWDDYGGMNQYVAWSGTASAHDDFYSDENCRSWYKDHVYTVLNRVNTFNGRVYREDPTVFAWELANEPRCESDPTGATLGEWIVEMSSYIKSIDAAHLVTTGSEGFYGPAGPDHNPHSWMSSLGVDFVPHHAVETIDFACIHGWPDWWGMDYAQSMSWMSDHIDDSTELLGKPVILEEFGKQRPVETRDLFFQGWFDEIYQAAQAGEAAGGSNLWILYHDDYPDYDGFGVYCPEDSSTCGIIAAEAERMNSLVAAGVEDAGQVGLRGPAIRSFPNPFNPAVSIEYAVPADGPVLLAVYDLCGRMVRTLVDRGHPAGVHTARWDGRDVTGAEMGSGVYFALLKVEESQAIRKLVLIR
ncbi:MAG: cellulase family glycosylhydrolase [Candidatus Eisenbacteria bacterium]